MHVWSRYINLCQIAKHKISADWKVGGHSSEVDHKNNGNIMFVNHIILPMSPIRPYSQRCAPFFIDLVLQFMGYSVTSSLTWTLDSRRRFATRVPFSRNTIDYVHLESYGNMYPENTFGPCSHRNYTKMRSLTNSRGRSIFDTRHHVDLVGIYVSVTPASLLSVPRSLTYSCRGSTATKLYVGAKCIHFLLWFAASLRVNLRSTN